MAKTIPPFTGFPESAMELLAELPKRDKAWFEDWRDLYEESILLPSKALVVEIGNQIQDKISPTLIAKPAVNGSLSPIFRDLRFSTDKSPFKDNLMFNFWDGPTKKTAPTLRIRITPKKIGFATGTIFAQQPDLDQWRGVISDELRGASLQKEIDSLSKNLPLDITEPELKKPPHPFAVDHPRAQLLRHKSIQLRWEEDTPENIATPGFASWCVTRLLETKPIHLALKEALNAQLV